MQTSAKSAGTSLSSHPPALLLIGLPSQLKHAAGKGKREWNVLLALWNETGEQPDTQTRHTLLKVAF